MVKVNQVLGIIGILILIFCVSCSPNQAPLEFAPNPEIIEKAIIFKIKSDYSFLSEQLGVKKPKLKVVKVNITKIKPIIIQNLPTYHLEGTYTLNVKNNKSKKITINNSFNLDLQRQSKGKTWKILIKANHKNKDKYFSYNI